MNVSKKKRNASKLKMKDLRKSVNKKRRLDKLKNFVISRSVRKRRKRQLS